MQWRYINHKNEADREAKRDEEVQCRTMFTIPRDLVKKSGTEEVGWRSVVGLRVEGHDWSTGF